MDLLIRRADVNDLSDIKKLVNSQRAECSAVFGDNPVLSILEHSILSVVAVTAENDLVAFAAFKNEPPERYNDDFVGWFDSHYAYPEFMVSSTLWLSYFVAAELYDTEALKQILTSAFGILPLIDVCMLYKPDGVLLYKPLSSMFILPPLTEEEEERERKIMSQEDGSEDLALEPSVFIFPRETLIPNLLIRPARIQDHDDLVPIFESQSEVLRSIYGDFFLADVIYGVDDNNKVLVGLNPKKVAVGIMAISTEIDLKVLQESFQLEPYDNLVKELDEIIKEEVIKPVHWTKIIEENWQEFQKDFPKKREEGMPKELYNSLYKYLNAKGEKWGYTTKVQPNELGLDVICALNLGRDNQITFNDFQKVYQPLLAERNDRIILDRFYEWYMRDGELEDRYHIFTTILALCCPDDAAAEAKKESKKDNKKNANANAKEEEEKLYETDVRSFFQKLNIYLRQLKAAETEKGGNPNLYDYDGNLEEDIRYCLNFKALPQLSEDDPNNQKINKKLLAELYQQYDYKVNPFFRGQKIALIGPPCSGLTTQARLLAKRYGYKIISPEILMEQINTMRCPEVQAIREFSQSGQKVPHELLIKLAIEKLKGFDINESGYILDGMIKTVSDYKMLCDSGNTPTFVILIETDETCGIEHMQGRLYDTATGEIYHKDFNPPPAEISDRCEMNDEDSEATLAVQLSLYREHIEEIENGLPITVVDGTGTIDTVYTAVEKLIFDTNYKKKVREIEILKATPVTIPTRPNAFGVTLFCVDESFQSRSIDFLDSAFECFPNMDYLILTMPPSARPFPLLQSMIRVPNKVDHSFSHNLYIIHRNTLSSMRDLTLRQIVIDDLPRIKNILSNVNNKDEILQSLQHVLQIYNEPIENNPEQAAFAFIYEEQIVGLTICTREYTTRQLVTWTCNNFAVEDYCDIKEYLSKNQATVLHFVINPLFIPASRFCLQEVMRYYQKELLYYRIYPDRIFSTIIEEFIQVKPRSRKSMENLTLNSIFALSILPYKYLTEPRIKLNHRIVIVGASDCGLSAIENLLFIPYLFFANIILVSPLGLPYQDVDSIAQRDSCYTSQDLHLKGFESRVKIVNNYVVDLDRENKCAILDNEKVIPYDSLVLTPGLQDSTKKFLEKVGPIPPQVLFAGGRESVGKAGEYINDIIDNGGYVVVYGSSMEALTCVNYCIAQNSGALRGSISLVMSKTLNTLIGDNGCVQDTLNDQFQMGGVKVIAHHKLKELKIDGRGNLEGAVFTVLDDDGSKTEDVIECSLLVCADQHDVDPYIFSAINNTGLVYDGRLVVDSFFRTTDKNIFAAGTIAKWSRRYRHGGRMELYNSLEAGYCLSQSLLYFIDPVADYSDVNEETHEPPVFNLPRTVRCNVPFNLNYFFASKLKEGETPLAEIVTAVPGRTRYCKISLDKDDIIAAITCLSDKPVNYSHLEQLIGVHQSYVNSLVATYNEGRIPDLLDFLEEEWADVLYHDRFRDFMMEVHSVVKDEEGLQEILSDMIEGVQSEEDEFELAKRRRALIGFRGNCLNPSTTGLIQSKLLHFLQQNAARFKTLYIPGTES